MTDINEIKEFLTGTDEGKALLEEFKKPLLSKRDELFEQLKGLKSDMDTIKAEKYKELQELDLQAKRVMEEKLLKDNDLVAFKKFHEDEVNSLKNNIKSVQQKYAQKEVERLISETASKYSKAPKPLQLLLKERVQSDIDEQGNITISVLDDSYKPMYWEGTPATLDHLVETLKAKEEYQPFFVGAGVSGSGTQRSEPIQSGVYKDMSSAEFNLTKTMQRTKK